MRIHHCLVASLQSQKPIDEVALVALVIGLLDIAFDEALALLFQVRKAE